MRFGSIPSLQVTLGVAAAIPMLGCPVDDNDESFRVSAVAFDGESTITLTFTEPVGELADVDPAAFRLSFASSYTFTYTSDGVTQTYEYTSYNDLAGFIDDYYTDRVTVTSLTPGTAANQIVLQTNAAWGTPACDFVEYLAVAVRVREEYARAARQLEKAAAREDRRGKDRLRVNDVLRGEHVEEVARHLRDVAHRF